MPHVLLVEDDFEVCDILGDFLREAGYRCSAVGSTLEASKILTEERIDLLVTDVALPGGGSGMTVAENATRRGIPVVMISGGSELDPDECDRRGWRYLDKPFRMESFVDLVERALQN